MIKELFEYIEKKLETHKIVSLDTWGNKERSDHYYAMKKFYNPDSPVVKFNDKNYIITFYGVENGHGGMSEGSPDTFDIKRVEHIVDITKSVQRPYPVESPDFKPLIKQLEEHMNDIVKGNYSDEDDDHYAWETAMQCVYGKDIFNWYNENVT